MRRRILTVVLCVLIMISATYIPAFAENGTQEPPISVYFLKPQIAGNDVTFEVTLKNSSTEAISVSLIDLNLAVTGTFMSFTAENSSGVLAVNSQSGLRLYRTNLASTLTLPAKTGTTEGKLVLGKLKITAGTDKKAGLKQVDSADNDGITAPGERSSLLNKVEAAEQSTGKTDADVSITTNIPASKTYGDDDFTLTASAANVGAGTGVWTWTSSDSSILEIVSGNTITATIKVKKADTGGASISVKYESDTTIDSATSAVIPVGKKDVSITGVTAENKVYNNSPAATASGTAIVSGKVGSDDVTVTAGTATFADKNVGNGKTVTFTGYALGGTAANNYNLTAQPANVSANITPASLTITVAIVAAKTFDNTTAASISEVTLSGDLDGLVKDTDYTVTGVFNNANVAAANKVTVTVVLKDTDKAKNYSAPAAFDKTASINKATPSGTPTYTAISEAGKTLADANLTIDGIIPDGGTISWDLGDRQTVAANTAYNWTYTPSDTANYNVLKGSLTPYVSAPPIGGGSVTSSFTLTFNTNGGSELDAVKKNSGETVDLTAYKPTREGYNFGGWYSDQALTAIVTSVKLDKDITVYAKWVKALSFADVKDGDYFKAAVDWAVENGITEGTSATTFSPDDTVTRAQVVTMLWRAASKPAQSGGHPFVDVEHGAYYETAVMWAAEERITEGTSATTFHPADGCVRAQIVTFLWRDLGK